MNLCFTSKHAHNKIYLHCLDIVLGKSNYLKSIVIQYGHFRNCNKYTLCIPLCKRFFILFVLLQHLKSMAPFTKLRILCSHLIVHTNHAHKTNDFGQEINKYLNVMYCSKSKYFCFLLYCHLSIVSKKLQ